jgi:hypothetical protein
LVIRGPSAPQANWARKTTASQLNIKPMTVPTLKPFMLFSFLIRHSDLMNL